MRHTSTSKERKSEGSGAKLSTKVVETTPRQPEWIIHLIQEIGKVIRIVTGSAALVLIARYIAMTAIALSGRQTDAKISVTVSVIEKLSAAAGIAAGGGGLFVARRHSKLRKREVEQALRSLNELRTQIDPKRGTSSLNNNHD